MGLKVVKKDDPGYIVSDGLLVGNRAFLEITPACPVHIQAEIQGALNHGWIRVCATFTEEEYAWLILKE